MIGMEEDLLEIVNNFKQEEPEYTNENFVIVSDSTESTNINFKQEYKEEDPLKIADDYDLKQEVQTSDTSEDNQNKIVPKKVRYNCDKCDKSYSTKDKVYSCEKLKVLKM